MKKLTVYDATKEELIQYFFNPLAGGMRINADKDRFTNWLWRKRTDDLIKTQEEAIEASQKNLNEYIRLVKKANDTKDMDEKLEVFDRANKAWEAYQKAEKAYARLDKQITENLGV